jgi:hypothetical protein
LKKEEANDSGDYKDLLEKHGLTAERIAERIANRFK